MKVNYSLNQFMNYNQFVFGCFWVDTQDVNNCEGFLNLQELQCAQQNTGAQH